VLRAPKRLEGSLEWRPQHRSKKGKARGARLNLVATLDAGGVTLEGVDFVAAATASEPDRKVAMQLRVLYSGKYRPFTRVDWRGSPHTNRNYPASPLNLKMLGETHIHRLRDNASLGWPGIVATADDLPVADATPELADFSALITYIAQEFAIENANEIREPPWEPLLSNP
jgi:hypothetical protein